MVNGRLCTGNSLDKSLVNGKIVLCDSFMPSKETAPLLPAGVAGVVMQKVNNDVAYSYPLPASVLDVENGRNLYLYISSPGYVLYYVSQKIIG